MQIRTVTIEVAVLALSACGQTEQPRNTLQETNGAERAPTPIPPPGTGPDARTPFAPMKSAEIDPKSPQAAANVVAEFADLLKAKRYADAHRLWSGDVMSDAKFAARFAGYEFEGVAIGKPGAVEGAAGSLYVDVPLRLFFANGDYTGSLAGKMTLRRVNDVPGSTADERRWHIVKADLRPAD